MWNRGPLKILNGIKLILDDHLDFLQQTGSSSNSAWYFCLGFLWVYRILERAYSFRFQSGEITVCSHMNEWWTHLLRAFSWKWVFENEMFRWESGYLFLFFFYDGKDWGELAIVNTFCGFALPWIAPDKKIAEEEGYVIWCKIFLWERTLARNLWFLFPLALILK